MTKEPLRVTPFNWGVAREIFGRAGITLTQRDTANNEMTWRLAYTYLLNHASPAFRHSTCEKCGGMWRDHNMMTGRCTYAAGTYWTVMHRMFCAAFAPFEFAPWQLTVGILTNGAQLPTVIREPAVCLNPPRQIYVTAPVAAWASVTVLGRWREFGRFNTLYTLHNLAFQLSPSADSELLTAEPEYVSLAWD